jgi:hypothetical protein
VLALDGLDQLRVMEAVRTEFMFKRGDEILDVLTVLGVDGYPLGKWAAAVCSRAVPFSSTMLKWGDERSQTLVGSALAILRGAILRGAPVPFPIRSLGSTCCAE